MVLLLACTQHAHIVCGVLLVHQFVDASLPHTQWGFPDLHVLKECLIFSNIDCSLINRRIIDNCHLMLAHIRVEHP